MAEEKDDEKEIQDILSDLDAILSGLNSPAEAEPPAPAPKPEPAVPVLVPKLPPASVAPPAPKPNAEPPAAVLAAAKTEELKIELGSRPIFKVPPESKPAPAAPKPPAFQTKPPMEIPAPAPATPAVSELELAAASSLGTAAGAAQEGSEGSFVISEKVPKDQIRRVGVVYTPNYVKEKGQFLSSLEKAGETVSKKQLYLRKVSETIVEPTINARLFAEKMKSLGVVAVVGVLEGFPEPKARELAEALDEGGLMFRVVAAADVQKRSLAVDIIVDMMLLGHE